MKHYENAVKLTAQLYDARDAMRYLHGDKFPAKVEEYQGYIRAQMKRDESDEMAATMALAKKVRASGLEMSASFTVAMLLAAYVEMIEPSAE